MKKYFFLLLLVGCSTPKQQPDPLQTVKDFISWYGAHYKEANSFAMVNQGDSTFYSVNFEETEKFLAYMKSSGFVSKEYLDAFRRYFAEAQLAFEKEPVNEGPPMNFDYDIVLWTQEPELVIEKGKDPVVIFSSVRDDEAELGLDVYTKLQFELSKDNDTWKIDRVVPTEGN
jgi:hypothetical protein